MLDLHRCYIGGGKFNTSHERMPYYPQVAGRALNPTIDHRLIQHELAIFDLPHT